LNVRLRPNNAGFERLRTLMQAVILTDADRRGPLLIELSDTHVRQVRRAFASAGATVDGGPWPAWRPRYAKWRKKVAGVHGRSMMRLRGPYRGRGPSQLFVRSTQRGNPNFIRRWLGGMRFAFGFADDVGAYHQDGAGRLPVRSVIDKTEADFAEFVDRLVSFYRKRLAQVYRPGLGR
jgi:hypothetical protein